MGIQVELNPDLALRNYAEFSAGRRKKEECIPKKLQVGRVYSFLKKGQRNYWLQGEIPLLETKGEQVLSRPKASIRISTVTHLIKQGEVWTQGTYKIVTVFANDDPTIHFESYARI